MPTKHEKRKYEVVAYDPDWKEHYETLKAQFARTFEDCNADIHHIGGTAVPGLASQPIIDMLVVVPDIHCLDRHLAELKQFGYLIEHDYVGAETILAYKQKEHVRHENIHILPQGYDQIDQFLAVKEYYEVSPEEAAEYGDLKLELFAKYPKNYDKYRVDRDAWLEKKKKKDILPWYRGEE